MKPVRLCDQCHEELPGTAPEGLCPRCLLKQGGVELGIAVRRRDALVAVTRANATPRRLGNYEVLEKIGQGGMGTVYKARQLNLERMVALKLLPFGAFSRPEVVQRFRSEASAAAALQHPNIVAVHDVGEQDGQPYFSMDFVEGNTLAELVRNQPLSARRAAVYLKAIAEAVHYAHQHGIIHRDLKPSNILIDSADQPRITDFGLAKRLASTSDFGLQTTDLTLTGQVLGSPNFVSPEQAEGRSEAVGPASDIYSLGALLYCLLTRQPPFQAESLTALLKQVIENDPVTPRLLNPGIPRDLETICLKCLEKEAPRRYSTAQKLADDLGRFLEGKTIQARPVGAAGKVWKWCKRRPALAGMAVALLASVVLGLAGVLWQWHRAIIGEALARQNAEAEMQQRQRAEAGEYAADMRLAQSALGENNHVLAVSLLEKYRPEGKSEFQNTHSALDLRGWEWRYLWQLCQSDEIGKLHQYTDAVFALTVSKDGKLLAVRIGDKVALWDPTTKKPVTELPNAVAEALAFSPVENLLAWGSRDAGGQPTIVLWDVDAGTNRKTLNYPAPVTSVAFSPDGKLLATFNNRGGVAIREVATGLSLTNLTVRPPRESPCGVVAFSPDGSQLAIGEDYGRLTLLDWRTGKGKQMPVQTIQGIMALVFSPRGDLVATGYSSSATGEPIRLWDTSSGQICGRLTNHTSDVYALAFTPDGRRLISASADGTIRVWDVAGQRELHCLRTRGDVLRALALLSDGHILVSAGYDCAVSFWDINQDSPRLVQTNLVLSFGFEALAMAEPESFATGALDPKVVHRFGVAFSPDSRSFITLERDGSINVWRSWPPEVAERLPMLGTNNWSVALSPDGHWLAVGNASGKVQFWDWKARRLQATDEVPFEWCGGLRFSRSGEYLVARIRLNDRFIFRVWRTRSWQRMPLPGPRELEILSLDLSPNDCYLAAAHADGNVRLWSFPAGRCEATFNEGGWTMGLLFSNAGQMLISASNWLKIWDVKNRRELAATPLHGTWSAALSPDGRRLAIGGDSERALTLWDLNARKALLVFSGKGHYYLDTIFSPDGNTLVATSLDGLAHFWHAPSWEEIEKSEREKSAEARTATAMP